MAVDPSALLPFGGEALAGLFAGLAVVVFLLVLAIYIYTSVALMVTAKKTKTNNAWLAWIPFANVYLMTQVGKLPGWWTLVLILPFIPFVGIFLMWAGMAYIWWKIAEARKLPGWLGILIIVPLVNLVIMGVIAWHK